ncbi:hypothetical protein tb265_49540 [Gemmatimonadetes bacterium T265]|nr:hypothetical protein tb265_49540 [Gemmatimonadetes bacterium T265]
MGYNVKRPQELALALTYLGVHDGQGTWKGSNWGVMEGLWNAGLISDPKGRAKSVWLTDDGLAPSEAMFREYFQPCS